MFSSNSDKHQSNNFLFVIQHLLIERNGKRWFQKKFQFEKVFGWSLKPRNDGEICKGGGVS